MPLLPSAHVLWCNLLPFLQWFTFPLLTVVFQFGDIKGLVDNRTVSASQHTAFGRNRGLTAMPGIIA